MRLLVNHQLIPIAIQPISLTNLLRKISRYCRNLIALSSFFDVKNQRPKKNLESATNVVYH